MMTNPIKTTAVIATTALALVASSVMPAASAPWGAPGVAAPSAAPVGVEPVQYRRPGPPPGPVYRHGYRQGYRQGFYNNGGRHYYNGHRGYNYYRPGYRQYNGWWFPAAAFATGALIGGAIAAQPAPRAVAPSAGGHVQWCANQYRSYRASDNTYQPLSGPRRQCVSPYG